jgi:hypothetical protein
MCMFTHVKQTVMIIKTTYSKLSLAKNKMYVNFARTLHGISQLLGYPSQCLFKFCSQTNTFSYSGS